ncbi:MAG: hypothetical protein IPK82_11110 [Polyangiaceae bacterium]|nr:hypothetical protein [Polyangiaceae bacterium]
MTRAARRAAALLVVLGTSLLGPRAGADPGGPPASASAAVAAPAEAPAGAGRTVLYLTDEEFQPSIVEVSSRFRSTLRALAPAQVSVDVQTLDPKWLEVPDFREKLHTLLAAKFTRRAPDVLVAITLGQLRFALDLREHLWPEVPIVFGVEGEKGLTAISPRGEVTGRFVKYEAERTLEGAFKLLPGARRVALIAGSTALDKAVDTGLEGAIRARRKDMEVVRLEGLPFDELEPRVGALPADTILFFLMYRGDAAGRKYVGADVVEILQKTAKAPIFSMHKTSLDHGILGGVLVDYGACGDELAELALRVLQSEPASTIPIGPFRPQPYILDARQLERFGIPESRAPEGAKILFRTPTLWEQYRVYFLAVGGALVLQAFLIAVLLAERRRRRVAQAALAERLRLEELLGKVSAGFTDLAPEDIHAEIKAALGRFGEALGAARAGLWRLDDTGARLTHGWHSRGADPPPAHYSASEFPVGFPLLMKGEAVRLRRSEDGSTAARATDGPLPAIAKAERISIPIRPGPNGTVMLCFMHSEPRIWSDDILHSLRGLGEILGRALFRLETEGLVRRSEALNRAVLSSLPGYVAILDAEGKIARENGAAPDSERAAAIPGLLKNSGEQADYLETFRKAAEAGDVQAGLVVQLLREVLSGEVSEGVVEVRDPALGKWFEVRARKLSWDEPAVLVAHLDISSRKRAELEAQRSLANLAHVNRVAGMGALTSSIAHEINQPLAAIRNNAEAARRLLSRSEPDIAEALLALDDILVDDEHAGEVIRRIRALLKKGEVRRSTQDLVTIVREVARIVAGDAALRSVALVLELPEEPLLVLGDGVQLQQIALNLVTNALDAVDGLPLSRRRIVVRAGLCVEGVEFCVEDAGKGFEGGDPERVFEAFYSTKAEGMGIGLAISRSLAEAHGGTLTAAPSPEGGAIFRCVLPAGGKEG